MVSEGEAFTAQIGWAQYLAVTSWLLSLGLCVSVACWMARCTDHPLERSRALVIARNLVMPSRAILLRSHVSFLGISVRLTLQYPYFKRIFLQNPQVSGI